MRFGSRITAAATTGPANGPRPASSQPATGIRPRLIAARSRRNDGRRMGSSSGKRAAAAVERLMRPLLPARFRRRNGKFVGRWNAVDDDRKPLPFARQGEIVLEQMKRCAEAAGASLERVVKCNVYC